MLSDDEGFSSVKKDANGIESLRPYVLPSCMSLRYGRVKPYTTLDYLTEQQDPVIFKRIQNARRLRETTLLKPPPNKPNKPPSGGTFHKSNTSYNLPTLNNPDVLPGDCHVAEFIEKHVQPFLGDPHSFLAPATARTKRAWDHCEELLRQEEEAGGVLDVYTVTPSTITSHAPGYVRGEDDDIIVGLQTDQPLKRSCKPKGGFRVVKNALQAYGFTADPQMEATYGPSGPVETHNDVVFQLYIQEMKRARHVHLLTGLPDAYGRGRLVADARRIPLYGVNELIAHKQADFNAITGSSMEAMRLRAEISKQIVALQELLIMADSYGVDLRQPATTFREATQALWMGHLAALKQQDGAAMSVGRWDNFLDIYAQQDLHLSCV